MAEHTKIVEFYGLPGCGKTTLCKLLKEQYEKKGYKIGLINDATKSCTIPHLLKVVSINNIWGFINWCHSIMKVSHTSFNIAGSPYKRMLIYKCIRSFSQYDYIFIEHGIVQSIVSSLYGVDNYKIFMNRSICKSLLNFESADIFIYCQVTIEESFKRIKKRNRKSSGRFDQLPEDELADILTEQADQFNLLANKLKVIGHRNEYVSNNNSLEECLKDVSRLIG